MSGSKAEKLIRELLVDPTQFGDTVKGNDLLHEYFLGYPVETLRPLLAHPSEHVRSAAAFVASELGIQAKNLIDDAIRLAHDSDPRTRFAAIEVILVCSVGKNAYKFEHVARALQDEHEGIKRLTMGLVSNADISRLKAAIEQFDSNSDTDTLHRQGLLTLTRLDSINHECILEMLHDSNQLTRQYGAIAAKKLSGKYPDLLNISKASPDSVISGFIGLP